MDFQVRLVVGSADDVRDRGALRTQLALDRHEDVHVVEYDQVLTAFGVCLHRLVLIHSPPEAKGQVAGKRQRFAGLGFILVDKLPGTGHIYFKQRVDAVLPPIQVEVIVSVAPCGWDLYDAIGEGCLRHKNSSPKQSHCRNAVLAESEPYLCCNYLDVAIWGRMILRPAQRLALPCLDLGSRWPRTT